MLYPVGTGTGGVGKSTIAINVRTRSVDASLANEIVLENQNAPYQVTVTDLSATTYTAITVPTKAGGVIINPPTGNTQSLTLKGASGDTGIVISRTAPTVLSFHTTAPATLGLYAGGAITGLRLEWF